MKTSQICPAIAAPDRGDGGEHRLRPGERRRENMTPLEKIQQLYRDYILQAEELEKNKRPTDGMFGLTRKPADDVCHEQFIQHLNALMAEFRLEGIASDQLRDVLEMVFFAAQTHREPASIYWMLIAAHSATPDMIPLLNREDAKALYDQYCRVYKRGTRLPVQKKLVKELEKAMK